MISTSSALLDGRRHHPSALRVSSRINFAHPSERVFAELLDLYEVVWDYEPIEFPLSWNERGTPTAGFRPDFWLPGHQCFVELTTADQRLVTRKNAKVRRFRALYPEIEISVVYQRDFFALAAAHGIAPESIKAA